MLYEEVMSDKVDTQYLYFTKTDFINFKKCYHLALANKQELFEFKDHQFVIGYAKYVIEYLSTKFIDK